METTMSQRFEFQAEMKQLLNIIIHSLYTHEEIFLRELISNASDALNKIRFRQVAGEAVQSPDAPLHIIIEQDKDLRTITLTDTGIGMTEEDLKKRLGTVAASGTLEFLKQVKEEQKTLDGNLIGQFGMGFYSVFMVAEKVIVDTLHADPSAKAVRWTSEGKGEYTIEESDKDTRGTTITIYLKEDKDEYTDAYRIKQIIKKYSNFIGFPIKVGEESVNTLRPVWVMPKEEVKDEELTEFYKFISNDYREPLGHLHVALEGAVNFKSLLFIPQESASRYLSAEPKSQLNLYTNRVLIQTECEHLLPPYLSFVRGVVDTEDLPLNVSREVTQNSPVTAKINKILTGKILGLLEDWSREDKEKYLRFYKGWGHVFKLGINADYANREKLLTLLRFESMNTVNGEMLSLQEYIEKGVEQQDVIYYVSGERRDEALRNPNLELFRKKGIDVLVLTDPIDIFIVPTIDEFQGKKLQSVDKADISALQDNSETEQSATTEKGVTVANVLSAFRDVLGDKVEDVVASKRLVDSAVTLVAGKEALDIHMEKMMKMMDKGFTGSKRILEVNLSHRVIQNLANMYAVNPADATLKAAIHQLYEGALLLEGNLPSPAEYVTRMTELLQKATEHSV